MLRTSTIEISFFFDHFFGGRKTLRLFVCLSLTVFDREESFFKAFLMPYDIFSKCFPFFLDLESLVLALVQTIFLDLETSVSTIFRTTTFELEISLI